MPAILFLQPFLDGLTGWTRGFALLAYPADYGSSGIMTFQVNQSGTLYQKDLGANTAELAAAVTSYNPDEDWQQTTD